MRFLRFNRDTDKIASFIFSYNRLELLKQSVAELKKFSEVHVIDDCSDNIEGYHLPIDITFHKTNQNYGKRGFWKLWRAAFQLAKESDATYFIFTAEDLLGWKESEVMRGIRHTPESAVINFFRDHRDSSWNGIEPRDCGYFRQVFFVDCAVLIPRDVMEQIDWFVPEVPADFPHNSSGVGYMMTQFFNANSITIMQPKRSWVEHHGNDCSVMHGKNRNFKAKR